MGTNPRNASRCCLYTNLSCLSTFRMLPPPMQVLLHHCIQVYARYSTHRSIGMTQIHTCSLALLVFQQSAVSVMACAHRANNCAAIVMNGLTGRTFAHVARRDNGRATQTSISCRQLTRATVSCCRQSLTITRDKLQRSTVGAYAVFYYRCTVNDR